jgi:tripartite-type tricarboxylate transporter receptor subunit TctC
MKKLLLTILLLPSLALAWQPIRPITVIFPNAPGAGNEISFRFVASIVEKKTKTTFASEYRPGADGNIAMNYFATVPADGYTIAVPACQSNWVTADIWYSNMLKYDAQSFEPVANIARSPLTFWANPKSNINTPTELADVIKNSTRPIAIAIGGGGHRLAVEYLTESLGVPGSRIEAVMYKGPAQALVDVIGGHVEFGVTPVAVGWPHVQTGKLKLIGIANEYPLKGLEKAPLMKTVAPGLFIHGCWNIVLPKGTPADVQAWYHEQFVPAIRSSEAAEKFAENMMFITPAEHTPEGVRKSMAQLRQVWQPIAKKVKPE